MSEEHELVKSGHPGTVESGWSWGERKIIAETGTYPTDVRWHHINSVKANTGLAEIPNNIIPARGFNKGHVGRYHPRGTRAGSTGPLLDRETLIRQQYMEGDY